MTTPIKFSIGELDQINIYRTHKIYSLSKFCHNLARTLPFESILHWK